MSNKKEVNKWVSKNFSKLHDLYDEWGDHHEKFEFPCDKCDKKEITIRGTLRGRTTDGYFTYPELRKRSLKTCSHCGGYNRTNDKKDHKTYKCKECDKDFLSTSGRVKFCSDDCRFTNYRKVNKKSYEKDCEVCGNHFVTGMIIINTCSEECKSTKIRDSNRRPLSGVSCQNCGEIFQGTPARTICSDKCRKEYKKFSRRKGPSEIKCVSCDNMVMTPTKKCDVCKKKKKVKPIYSKTCPTCDKKFNTTNVQKIYCKAGHVKSNIVVRKEAKRLRKRQQVQARLSCETWREIGEFIKDRPDGCHLDHIIPLNHPDICGLHNTWNFQWLESEDNIFKSNKFDYTSENNSWKNILEED